MEQPLASVRFFAPELWGQVDMFSKLCAKTYTFTRHGTKALKGVQSHFEKAIILRRLCDKLIPNLELDKAELEEKGFSPTHNSRELSAVVESCILELYASLDCCAKILISIYGQNSRGFKKSTRWLFANFDEISGSFPNEVKEIFRTADWYSELRVLRDELTHLDTGSCHLDYDSQTIRYMHTGIEISGKALVVEDIMSWLNVKFEGINQFLGMIFSYLNSTLANENVMQLCGIGTGRLYARMVNPTEALTKDSGSCLSHNWFDLPEHPSCPFVEQCGAYLRKASLSDIKQHLGVA
jgi:hypothetical protein